MRPGAQSAAVLQALPTTWVGGGSAPSPLAPSDFAPSPDVASSAPPVLASRVAAASEPASGRGPPSAATDTRGALQIHTPTVNASRRMVFTKKEILPAWDRVTNRSSPVRHDRK